MCGLPQPGPAPPGPCEEGGRRGEDVEGEAGEREGGPQAETDGGGGVCVCMCVYVCKNAVSGAVGRGGEGRQ